MLEGSAEDLKKFVSDKDVAYIAARSELRAEQATDSLKRLKSKAEDMKEEMQARVQVAHHQAKLDDKERQELGNLRMEVGSKTAALNAAEVEVRRLKEDKRNPVQLTAIQEAELEALFQEHLRVYHMPPQIFTTYKESAKITAEQLITQVFQAMATGNRVKAIMEMRAVSGLGLKQAKDLVENALLAHGVILTNGNAKGSVPTNLVINRDVEITHPPLLLREKNDVNNLYTRPT